MDKPDIIQSIIHNLKQDLLQAQQAAEEAMKGATHEQSKAETQYDTLGLEHAYLAEGQSRRIQDLTLEISKLENWQAPEFAMDDEIYLGALINLISRTSDQSLLVFIAPAGGAQKIEGINLQVITPDTPLACALLGKGVDDQVTLPNGLRFEITQLR